MLKETLEQNTQNALPESFSSYENEALLSQALSPFKDWKTFVKLPTKDKLTTYETLMKATLAAFGIESDIQFETKPSTQFFGVFLKPSKIVLNRYLLGMRNSVHTIIHECTHAYVHSIRTGELQFKDKALYDALCEIYGRYTCANGFHSQPEEVYADLVAYQLLQKHGFPIVYSTYSIISPKQMTAPKIKNTSTKAVIAIGEFALMLVLLITTQFMPRAIGMVVFLALYLIFIDMPKRMYWLEDCLKGKARQKLVVKRFEHLMELWENGH